MLYLTFSKVSERSKAPSTLQCALSDSHTMEAMSSKDYVCVKIKPHGLKISLPDEIVIMSAGVADDSNRCVRAIRGDFISNMAMQKVLSQPRAQPNLFFKFLDYVTTSFEDISDNR